MSLAGVAGAGGELGGDTGDQPSGGRGAMLLQSAAVLERRDGLLDAVAAADKGAD